MTSKLIDELRAGGPRRESAFKQLELEYFERLADPEHGLKAYSSLLSLMAQTELNEVREAFVNRFYNHLHPDVRNEIERQVREVREAEMRWLR